jgi:hypothetical protein
MGMERRRVPVDWEDLEMALTWHGGEWTSYLDLRTGHVVQSSVDFGGDLDEEGDLAEGGEECPAEGGPISERMAQAGLDEGYLVPIDPLASSVEYGRMEEFVETVTELRLKGRLEASLGGRGAFRRFKDSLIDYPQERARWFAFRWERMIEVMREWLADNDIEPTTEPPERKE